YQHWGFERAHGTVTTQVTFSRAHQSLVETILRTQLRLLRDELAEASAAAETNPVSYVGKLTESPHWLMPVDFSEMTRLHLVTVLQTLSVLENRSRSDSRSS